MRASAIAQQLPRWLGRRLLRFEAVMDAAVEQFARSMPDGARVLDAGAGQCRYATRFTRQRYVAVDLAVGDPGWDYSRLDVIADLAALPFPDASFRGCLNIVTLEHVPEPRRVLSELARVLEEGGRLLLVVPQEWEVHQAPHDYYRFTRYGLLYLLGAAGLRVLSIYPVGGFFSLMARRLLNAFQFLPAPCLLVAGPVLVPISLVLPLLDRLDRERNFTLGYVCIAEKSCA